MSDFCELKWQPTKEQLDSMILPAYTEMAKQSVAYVNKFGCPPEYVANMLRYRRCFNFSSSAIRG